MKQRPANHNNTLVLTITLIVCAAFRKLYVRTLPRKGRKCKGLHITRARRELVFA